ncbi:single Ig IL-1-related receptor [Periophthalmus magnuspinnatus]|uniref:single Ig IL-1-related receptor n=1 Tax=Periophthalmus magnuspinnatus TaxID=409849 RepID=UPI00145BDC3F|nr:single Ig IL-1-related receptor [Periophthalmus magnuspinnatus]
MALRLAVFFLLCTALSDTSSLVVAQSCVDRGEVREQVLFAGDQFPSYRLQCALDPSPQLTWLKDCVQLDSQMNSYLEFLTLKVEEQGNYTCVNNNSASYTVRLIIKERNCSTEPEFIPDGGPMTLQRSVGATVQMNCTALLLWHPKDPNHCNTAMHWSQNGHNITNHPLLQISTWSVGPGKLIVSSQLEITLEKHEDFGLYTCTVRNATMTFSVERIQFHPSHTAAVIGAIVVLALLGIAALVYAKCHLNIKMWYKNIYGDYELSDGKLYDAYISYVNNDHDRKFVNFILKPHLENKNGYKVHLNDNDILPGVEPSAELIMNMSRSRRLIIVLSYAYLEQDWCTNNFKQGFQHLLELCPRPILILLEGQSKRFSSEVKQQLTEHQHCLTILTWRHNSVTPSSVFWKELSLAMPRHLFFRSESSGDPQTLLHDDKDPMLTVDPDYLDCRSDTDPAGDLGVRLPAYKAMVCRAPVLPAPSVSESKPAQADVDVSDLGSRNYGARSDFYCLVTENDV